jgi:hypothetical protein
MTLLIHGGTTMTDNTALPPEGWFPDPEGSGRQRYWDGTQWTSHYYPPVGEAAMAPPVASTVVAGAPPRKKRRGKALTIVAAAVVVVLAATSVVVFAVVPALTAGVNGAVHDDPQWDYSYTDPMIGLEPDHEFEIPADYDLQAMADERAAEADPEWVPGDYSSKSFAFELFADESFTKHADALFIQGEAGEEVRIVPDASNSGFTAEGHQAVDIIEGLGHWGLHEEYFLMRKLDRDGSVLKKPVVTRFTVASALATPRVTFGSSDNDGNITFSWEPVEGANAYFIVTSARSFGQYSRTHKILAQTDATEWSSSESSMKYNETSPWVIEQNANMMMFSGGSVDSIARGFSEAGSDTEFDFGVIATDGTHFSSYETHDALEVAGTLPYEVASGASRELKRWGDSGFIEGIENVQTTIPFTSLDGVTRSTVAYIDPAEVMELADRWALPLRGRGTDLGEWAPVTKASVPDLAAAIAQYNAAATAAAPPTGMPQFETVSAPIDEFAKGVKDAPATDYPVYGSTPFTKFLAAHMIGQTSVIDISDFVGKPGVPDVFDAYYEARYQNPYVVNPRGAGLSSDGTKFTVTYSLTGDKAKSVQKAIHDQVDAVVGSVVTTGMSDRDKVTALNDWLAGNAEYDHEALNALNTSVFEGVPSEYENAWNAMGTLVDKRGVCASYAYAFNALANAAGVETVVVAGDVVNGGPHAWNKVKVDGTWLAVDPTWNDSPDANRFLMISDSEFTGSALRTQDAYWMIDLSIPVYATP